MSRIERSDHVYENCETRNSHEVSRALPGETPRISAVTYRQLAFRGLRAWGTPPASYAGRGASASGAARVRRIQAALPALQHLGRGPEVHGLAGLEQRLQAGQQHRPAAVDLLVGALANLVVRDGQPARLPLRLDLPGDSRLPLALDLGAPQRNHRLHEAARRLDLEVFAPVQEVAFGR